ncbi:MAG: GWxTD domain-containing protein [Balneolaceae bacterium]|nr:GWxTD domain-containing protein [Balneolaceae bacterium]
MSSLNVQKLSTSFTLLSLFATAFILGCARSFNPDIERGSSYKYRVGYPEVRLSAIGLLDAEDQPLINVAADIVYGSLIYKELDGKLQSKFSVDIQILDKSDNDELVKSDRYNLSIEKEDPNITHSQDVFIFQRQISVEPGEYQINVTVTDQNSRKQTTRISHTFIPDPGNEISNLTSIQMLGKDLDSDPDAWIPITTYDVQGKVDSLKFIFQVTNNRSDQPMTIDTKLIRYRSDSSVARSMYFTNYSQSSLPYKGIEYDESEVIQSNRRVLTQPGSVLIEFLFPQQERGNYRFEVTTTETEEESIFKARDFSVKSTNYPSLKNPIELARPLAYLMDDKEYERLLAIKNPDSMKAEIDRFWLKNIRDKNKAKSVIQMYYERVEEANKQFSNFKEGWKTDTGMVYILFGPPWYVEEHLDLMRWSYSYNRSDPDFNYTFEQTKLRSEFYPFENYILQRQQRYFTIQYQQVQLWLTGQILTRSI